MTGSPASGCSRCVRHQTEESRQYFRYDCDSRRTTACPCRNSAAKDWRWTGQPVADHAATIFHRQAEPAGRPACLRRKNPHTVDIAAILRNGNLATGVGCRFPAQRAADPHRCGRADAGHVEINSGAFTMLSFAIIFRSTPLLELHASREADSEGLPYGIGIAGGADGRGVAPLPSARHRRARHRRLRHHRHLCRKAIPALGRPFLCVQRHRHRACRAVARA